MIGIHSEVSSIASHGRGDGTLLVLVTEAYAHNENQYTVQIISPKPVSVIDSVVSVGYQFWISCINAWYQFWISCINAWYQFRVSCINAWYQFCISHLQQLL